MPKMMPVLFVGHGSPMNAIEENEFSDGWKIIASKIPKPKVILVISAHYYTNDTKINDLENPKMIYDMFGFPKELYQLKYPAKGSKIYAKRVMEIVGKNVLIDHSWGIDHGAWSVLTHMYPEADIPVLELSINRNLTLRDHLKIGEQLNLLREEGFLIIGSGNIVHNLNLISWDKEDGFPFANEFDDYIKENIIAKNINNIINYEKAGECAKQAFITLEHFIPLLYVIGASNLNDKIEIFNNKSVLGSLSMTSYLFSKEDI